MQRNTSLRSAVVLLMSALAVSGCEWPTVFPGPISEPGTTEFDNRLIGSWYALEGEEASYSEREIWYLNIALSHGNVLNGVIITTPPGPKSANGDLVAWSAATAWPSVVDGEVYYNVRYSQLYFERRSFRRGDLENTEVAQHRFTLVRVSFTEPDKMVFRAIGGPKVAALIKQGKLPGEEIGKFESYYFVDIDSAEIVSLLRDHPGDELFQVPDEPIVFHRLKPTVAGQWQ